MKIQSTKIVRSKLFTTSAKISNGVKKHQADIILAVGVILISLFSFAMGYILANEI